MRTISHVVLVVAVLAVGITLTGCPPDKGGLKGTWQIMESLVVDGVTQTMGGMAKFKDDGKYVSVNIMRFSGEGWSAELRAWFDGKYSVAGDVLTVDFSGSTCNDMQAKLVTSGNIPSEYQQLLDGAVAEELSYFFVPDGPEEPVQFSIDGDTLTLIDNEVPVTLARCSDKFDYSNADNACTEE